MRAVRVGRGLLANDLAAWGWRALVVVAAGFVLAACASSPDGGADVGPTPGLTVDVVDPAVSDEGLEFSPLAGFWNYGESPTQRAARLDEERLGMAEETQRCTGAAGFEYYAAVPEPTDPGLLAGSPPRRAFGEGFGIVGNYADPEWVIDQILVPLTVESAVDTYLASLSPQARGAYVETLAGNDTEIGCMEQANETVYGSAGYEFPDQLAAELDRLDQRIAADPRSVQASTLWQACMAESGYPYESQQDVIRDLSDSLQAILLAASFGDEFDMADFGTLLEQDPDEAFTLVRESLLIDRAAMDELREREVSASDADLECGPVLEVVLREVRAEYESAFLDGNRVELEAARAGLNGGGT